MSLISVKPDVQPPIVSTPCPRSKVSISSNDADSFSPKHFRFSQQRYTIDINKYNPVRTDGDIELGALVKEAKPTFASHSVKAAVVARTDSTMKLFAEDKRLPPTPPSPTGYSIFRYKLLTIYHILFFICVAANLTAFIYHGMSLPNFHLFLANRSQSTTTRNCLIFPSFQYLQLLLLQTSLLWLQFVKTGWSTLPIGLHDKFHFRLHSRYVLLIDSLIPKPTVIDSKMGRKCLRKWWYSYRLCFFCNLVVLLLRDCVYIPVQTRLY